MIKLTRRRVLLGVVCAALTLLPAVGGATTARPPARPVSAAESSAPAPPPPVASALAGAVVPMLESGALPRPPAPAAVTSGAPAPAVDLGPGPPAGWTLSEIPQFRPAPAAEPITLPPGDKVPYLSRVPVTQPVAFLTIDDGYLKNPEGPKLLAAAHVPVTLFLTTDAIRDDVAYFDRLRSYGAVIEAHTISHPELRGRSSWFQKRQICGSADRLGQWYGRRPVLFRPPFGDKDATTLRVARECGLTAGFMWKETVHEGKVRYQQGHAVQPGDVILMHFRPAFVRDFIAALQAIHRAGLTPALLEDYVPAAGRADNGRPGTASPTTAACHSCGEMS